LEGGRWREEEVALMELDSVGKAELVGVGSGEREGILGEIDGVDFACGPSGGQRERKHAASRAHVEQALGGGRMELEEPGRQLFGLGARDEGARVAQKDVPEKLDGAEEVLQGFAGGTASDKVAQGLEFFFAEGAIKLEVEVHAALSQGVS
jgi:hypothetical protein